MLIQKKSVQQVAALPFVVTGNGIEILLVTSRRRGRWMLPRGWPMKGMSLPQSAAQEALEEAGVTGVVHSDPVATYSYSKRMAAGYRIPCWVFVYPLLVMQQQSTWRESGERTVGWRSLGEAADLVNHAGLSKQLQQLAADDGQPLRAFMQTQLGDTGPAEIVNARAGQTS